MPIQTIYDTSCLYLQKLVDMRLFLGLMSSIILLAGCTRNNVTQMPKYKALFDQHKITGTFATYDNAYDEFKIYNLPRFKDSAYSPASTFKLIIGLMGLEYGTIVKNQTMKFTGDPNDSLKQDLNFNEAMRTSSNWYFRDVVNKLGRDTIKRMLDSLNYGNKKIDKIPDFFYNNTLRITPDEQMGIMQRIYFKKMNNLFSERTMAALKESLEMEKTDKYTLCYKTGTTTETNGKPMGWVNGWIQYGGNKPKVSFFVWNGEGTGSMNEFIENRMLLFRALMKEEGLLTK